MGKLTHSFSIMDTLLARFGIVTISVLQVMTYLYKYVECHMLVRHDVSSLQHFECEYESARMRLLPK